MGSEILHMCAKTHNARRLSCLLIFIQEQSVSIDCARLQSMDITVRGEHVENVEEKNEGVKFCKKSVKFSHR